MFCSMNEWELQQHCQMPFCLLRMVTTSAEGSNGDTSAKRKHIARLHSVQPLYGGSCNHAHLADRYSLLLCRQMRKVVHACAIGKGRGKPAARSDQVQDQIVWGAF